MGARSPHGVGFASARLAVCQYRDIVPLEERAHAITQVIPDALLVDSFGENAIEDEQLAALGNIDGDAVWRSDVNH